MNKILFALFAIACLLVPWGYSLASIADFSTLVADVRGNEVNDESAKNAIVSIGTKYVLSGLSAMTGIIVLGICIDGMDYRPRWMFWSIVLLGLIWLPLYSAGTMLGAALLLYAIPNYGRFHRKVDAE